jgi:hypothetical protein
MKPHSINQRSSARCGALSQPRGLGWAVRWVLVMVLVFDQLSSPFHRHHHGFDVDAGFDAAAAHEIADQLTASVTHVEDHDHGAHLVGHSSMALRSQTASTVDGSATSADALILATAFVLVFPATEADSPVRDWPDRGPPQFTTFKSLPPAGRAPPLHA